MVGGGGGVVVFQSAGAKVLWAMESKPIDRAALFKGLVVPPTADLSSGKESLHRASACARRAQIHARYSGENDAGSINWHGKASGSYNGWSAEGGHNRENILVAGVGLPFLSFRKLFHGDDSSHKSVSTGEPKVKVSPRRGLTFSPIRLREAKELSRCQRLSVYSVYCRYSSS